VFTKKTINYTGRVEGLDKKINFLAIPPDVYMYPHFQIDVRLAPLPSMHVRERCF